MIVINDTYGDLTLALRPTRLPEHILRELPHEQRVTAELQSLGLGRKRRIPEHEFDQLLEQGLADRSYDESQHENGCYLNRCCTCEQPFVGHKRRVVCRECAKESDQ